MKDVKLELFHKNIIYDEQNTFPMITILFFHDFIHSLFLWSKIHHNTSHFLPNMYNVEMSFQSMQHKNDDLSFNKVMGSLYYLHIAHHIHV